MLPRIHVESGDALTYACDLLVVKYAQARYGVDKAVANALSSVGLGEEDMSPAPGGYRLLETGGAISADSVMFAGVSQLREFGYREIRLFARKALQELAGCAPEVRSAAFTTHGAGYGLDEREAFESLVAGMVDALATGDVPNALTDISIVERNRGRAHRLHDYLSELSEGEAVGGEAGSLVHSRDADERLREVGYSSDLKPHVFVAMPFSEEKADHYHYGIQGAVNAAGYLCERVDVDAFTGDVLDRIRERISSASLVVADLSGANPNVYLEVGFAWGKSVPTVLLSDDPKGLRFDVQGQRCLTYSSIRDLETKLTNELTQLQDPKHRS